jgi:hypothetical protein
VIRPLGAGFLFGAVATGILAAVIIATDYTYRAVLTAFEGRHLRLTGD